MPYFKCVPCRIRLTIAGHEAGSLAASCPECGGALAPAPRLAELVGFRSSDLGDRLPAGTEPGGGEGPHDERVADITARRVAAQGEAWLMAASQALALPTPGARR